MTLKYLLKKLRYIQYLKKTPARYLSLFDKFRKQSESFLTEGNEPRSPKIPRGKTHGKAHQGEDSNGHRIDMRVEQQNYRDPFFPEIKITQDTQKNHRNSTYQHVNVFKNMILFFFNITSPT